MTDKPLLRKQARAARTAFGPRQIAPPPEFLRLLTPGLTLASYAPAGREADPSPLALAALDRDLRLVLPRLVDCASPLRFVSWTLLDELEEGPFGVRQPVAEREDHAPDIILAPLVAFDAALNRLGQGAGHYDRAFARFTDARRIGVAYSVQQVEAIPADPWDVPLEAVITERGWLTR